MNPRFLMNIALVLAGAAVAVASQGLGSGSTRWLMFGVSLSVIAVLAFGRLGRARVLDITTVALAMWSAVASVSYTGSTVEWLSLAEAIGFVGLAAVGLALHELKLERVTGRRSDPDSTPTHQGGVT